MGQITLVVLETSPSTNVRQQPPPGPWVPRANMSPKSPPHSVWARHPPKSQPDAQSRLPPTNTDMPRPTPDARNMFKAPPFSSAPPAGMVRRPPAPSIGPSASPVALPPVQAPKTPPRTTPPQLSTAPPRPHPIFNLSTPAVIVGFQLSGFFPESQEQAADLLDSMKAALSRQLGPGINFRVLGYRLRGAKGGIHVLEAEDDSIIIDVVVNLVHEDDISAVTSLQSDPAGLQDDLQSQGV